MVEIVNVRTGANSFVDECQLRFLSRDLAKLLNASEAVLLLLTDDGEKVHAYMRLHKGRYFLLRTDEFELENPDLEKVLAKQVRQSIVEKQFGQAFDFRRIEGLLGNADLEAVEMGMFDAGDSAKSIYDQCSALLGHLPELQSAAQRRNEAVQAIFSGVRKYYKGLKQKEKAADKRWALLSPLRESYKKQIKKLKDEPQFPELAQMVDFLLEKDFGKVYQRRYESTHLKLMNIKQKLIQTKEELKNLKELMDKTKAEMTGNMETLTIRVREAESGLLGTAVDVLSSYDCLRNELENVSKELKGSPIRGNRILERSNVNVIASQAQVRDGNRLFQEVKTLAFSVRQTHSQHIKSIACIAAQISTKLKIKAAEKFLKVEKRLNSLERNQAILTLPEKAPEIARAVVEELARRRLVGREISDRFWGLERWIFEEEQRRGEFLELWGKLVPKELFGDLGPPVPSINSLRKSVEEFAIEEGPETDSLQTEERELAALEAKYASELADLMREKEHAESLLEAMKEQVSEQEKKTRELQTGIRRTQGREPPVQFQALEEEVNRLRLEQVNFLAGLNSRS